MSRVKNGAIKTHGATVVPVSAGRRRPRTRRAGTVSLTAEVIRVLPHPYLSSLSVLRVAWRCAGPVPVWRNPTRGKVRWHTRILPRVGAPNAGQLGACRLLDRDAL